MRVCLPHRLRLGQAFSLVLLLSALSALCEAPAEPRLSQYMHTAWKLRDGDIAAFPEAFAQTNDGYLWVGTSVGLLRSDGMQFQRWSAPNSDAPNVTSIHALYASRDGSLWIGTTGKVARLHNGALAAIAPDVGRVNQLLEASDGKLWLARSRNSGGGLCEVTTIGNAHCFGRSEGLDCEHGNSLAPDGAGGFWVGANKLCHWSGHAGEEVPFPSRSQETNGSIVTSLIANPNGTITVGVAGAPKDRFGTEVVGLEHGEAKVLSTVDAIGKGEEITCLLAAKDGSLWVGTEMHGIYHVLPGRTDHYGTSDGLSGDNVTALFQDSENDLWVGTSEGIDRLKIPKILSLSTREGMSSNHVNSIRAMSDGSVWISTVDGLDRVDQTGVHAVPLGEAAGRQIFTTFEDASGSVWIATSKALLRYKENKITEERPKELKDFSPWHITQDRDQTVWIASTDLESIGHDGFHSTKFPGKPRITQVEADPREGLWLTFLLDDRIYRYRAGKLETSVVVPKGHSLRFFQVGADGSLWVPTGEGVLHWSGGSWKMLDQKHGLPCSAISETQQDKAENWWLSSRCGLIEVPHDEMASWVANPDHVVRTSLYGQEEGALSASVDFLPRSAVSKDGRVWFSGHSGVQFFTPVAISAKGPVPPVHIEHLLADGVEYTPPQSLRPLTKNIEIDYSGLSLRSPQLVRFRYALSGFDSTWQEANVRRQAFYQKLGPGRYEFRVIAEAADGSWNEVGDQITFTIPPAFYQTAWFKCICAIGVFAFLLLALRLRDAWALREIEEKLRERLMERDRIARELHDTLLQGFQSIVFRFQIAVNAIPTDFKAKEMLQDAIERADSVLKEGHARVRDLRREGTHLDLEEHIRAFLQEQVIVNDVTWQIETRGLKQELQDVIGEEMCAIAKESLLNSIKHSNATLITCLLVFEPKKFTLECSDDGTGIPEYVMNQGRKEGHFGLIGMRERSERIGASFKVSCVAGTTIQVALPDRIAYRPLIQNPSLFSWKRLLEFKWSN